MCSQSNIGEAMQNSALRFIALEHLTGMLGAAALAHIGRVRVRKQAASLARHRQALIFYGLSLLLILLLIPWPFRETGAPLFRGI